MAINTDVLGPRSSEEEEVFAIEALVFSVQISLQKAMAKHGASYKKLAERLGMSPARVSQIFSTKGANLTLRTIARIQHALGEEFEFVSKSEIKSMKKTASKATFRIVSSGYGSGAWKETEPCNTNQHALRGIAA